MCVSFTNYKYKQIHVHKLWLSLSLPLGGPFVTHHFITVRISSTLSLLILIHNHTLVQTLPRHTDHTHQKHTTNPHTHTHTHITLDIS